MNTTTLSTAHPLPAEWRDFLALTKPRVMTLVVFTGLCGLLVAPGPIHPVLAFTAILCIALGAGAAAGSRHKSTNATTLHARCLVMTMSP